MDEYLSDLERLEQAKKWWRENYKSIVLGAAIAILAVGGYRYWEYRTTARSETASALYIELVKHMVGHDMAGIDKSAHQLMNDYADTPYGSQAALALAQAQASEGKGTDAVQSLQWVMDHSSDGGLKLLARLRQASVKLSGGDAQGALDSLNGADAGAFAPLYAELRGDAELKLGKTEEARSAYQQALAGWDDKLGDRSLVQMKLDGLPPKAAKP